MLRFILIVIVCLGGFKQSAAQSEWHDIEEVSLTDLLDVHIETAAKHRQTIAQAPASITVVTADEMAIYGYETLAEALNHARGFYISNDRAYSFIGVRGFGRPADYNNRVLLLVNGLAINENIWGSSSYGRDFSNFIPGLIERVEVVRGPGSALYGTNAMFAVVNVITRDSLAQEQISVQAGSFGQTGGSFVVGKRLPANGAVMMSCNLGRIDGQDLYFADYDDPITNNGVAEGIDWEEFGGFTLKANYKNFSFQALHNDRQKAVPTSAWDTNFNQATVYRDQYHFAELKYRRPMGERNDLTARVYVNRYAYKGFYPYEESASRDKTDGRWLGVETQWQSQLHPQVNIVTGLEYQRHFKGFYKYYDAESVYFDRDFRFSIASVYAQAEWQAHPKISIVAGLRHDEYSRAGSSTNPRLAFIYQARPGQTIKLLYGQAFRAPTIYETEYYDPVSGYVNNPRLKPEVIRTEEAVWEARWMDGLSSSAAVYQYRVKDLIDEVPITDGDISLTQFQNLSRVETLGGDAEMRFQTNKRWAGYVNYSYQQAKDKAADRILTNSPQHLWRAGAHFSPLPYLTLAVEVNRESRRRTLADTHTKSFTQTDLTLSTPLRIKKTDRLSRLLNRLRFTAKVSNLLDEEIRLPGGSGNSQTDLAENGISQDGRRFWVKLDVNF